MEDATATAEGNRSKTDDALQQHIVSESAIVAGVLESALDRALAIDESRIDWGHPLVPPRPTLDECLAIRFQQDELSCACLLPSWMLPDASGGPSDDRSGDRSIPKDFPDRLVAAILPGSLPFHQPRRAELPELIDPELWRTAPRPRALRIPFDGREDPAWILLGVNQERQRIGSRRLHNVPVRVVVTLAEKRIEVGQLANIGPGTLITFSKPCEDLLDLYVNNRSFCRGEAVKIGEKFGLKITELGEEQPRISPVLNPT